MKISEYSALKTAKMTTPLSVSILSNQKTKMTARTYFQHICPEINHTSCFKDDIGLLNNL